MPNGTNGGRSRVDAVAYGVGPHARGGGNRGNMMGRSVDLGVCAAQLRDRFESNLNRLFYAGIPFVGGPQRVADMIEELAVVGDLDGFLFIFPDFVQGLKRFDEQVMPLLRKRGLRRLSPAFVPAPAAAAGLTHA
jgi:alkanesulfonate monooxygenase SsuD/methylene tetrahydromethanopterin reductase-like flavin-dependent oxidoreductase (luciferase family)